MQVRPFNEKKNSTQCFILKTIFYWQPCPDQQDFRAQQCSAYNDVPYENVLFKWEPHYDHSEPCALTCRYN